LRSIITPDNATCETSRRNKGDRFGRNAGRGIGTEAATKHATRIVVMVLATTLVAPGGRRAAMADFTNVERIGGSRGGSPGRPYWSNDLHQQSE
jgi:hypothetical protein